MKLIVCFSAVVGILAWQPSDAEQLKCQKGWQKYGDMSHMLEIELVNGKPPEHQIHRFNRNRESK